MLGRTKEKAAGFVWLPLVKCYSDKYKYKYKYVHIIHLRAGQIVDIWFCLGTADLMASLLSCCSM